MKKAFLTLFTIMIIVAILTLNLTAGGKKNAKKTEKYNVQLPVKWTSKDKIGEITIPPVPSVDEEHIFVVENNTIYRIESASGKIKDNLTFNSPIACEPLALDGRLIIPLKNGEITYLLDDLRHKPLWTNRYSKQATSAVIANSKNVLLFYENGLLVNINSESGSLLWKKEIHERIPFPPAQCGDLQNTIITTERGTMFSLDSNSGRIIWQKELHYKPTSQPACHRDKIYLSTETGLFAAFDADDGEEDWSYHTVANTVAAPSFWEETVCFASLNNLLYCRKCSNGSLIFRLRGSKRFYLPPLIVDGLIFAVPYNEDILVAVVEKKSLIGKAEQKNRIVHKPLPLQHKKLLIILDENGKIEALDYAHLVHLAQE